MKLDQFCVYCDSTQRAEEAKAALGLLDAEWTKDNVTGLVTVRNRHNKLITGVSKGLLQFNYDTGMEYELLTYLDGPNWHNDHNPNQNPARVGHVGYHLEDGEDFPDKEGAMWHDRCVQEMITIRHTNPKVLAANRRYHYRIYDTLTELGYYSKVIRRLGDGTSYPMPKDFV